MNLESRLDLRTGNRMPVMGLGTWELTQDTAGVVAHALELGYRLIDTSSDYGTQPGIGEAIRRSGVQRSEIFLTTKVEETDDAYRRTCSNLDELRVDYVDLMLIHRPPASGPGQDLWEGLIRAREDGLVRDIGVSNYSADLIDQLVEATGRMPAVNQIEWSPFGYSRAILDHARANRILIQAYSPLTRRQRLGDDRLGRIARRYGKSPAQLLIRWNLQFGTVPIPKANQRSHLEENAAVFDFEIEGEDMSALDDLNERYSSLGVLPYE